MLTATLNDATGQYDVTIGGAVQSFATEQAANEAIGNVANYAATRTLLRSAEGGAKYRDEAFGLHILRYVVNAEIKADKVKAKDLTADAVQGYVERIDDNDLGRALDNAKAIIAALITLRGKYQAPMRGGKLPRNVAEKFATIVKPESGAAQQEGAKAFIGEAL